MNQQARSIRAFVGAKNFELSRRFYKDLGFQEFLISHNMCYFEIKENVGFYLQDAYVADWVGNTMLFLEVEDVAQYYADLQRLELPQKYDGVRLLPVRHETWGKECFLHDPSGVLWHFGEFAR